jgi:transcriptional regulator with XRE-family HTH domain
LANRTWPPFLHDAMKGLESENWYVLLGVDPGASSFEINHAYKELQQLYREDSLASYSFFSKKERIDILARLEEAYSVLMDEEKRAEYDRGLVERGMPSEEIPFQEDRMIFRGLSTSRQFTQHALLTIRDELKVVASSNPAVQEILGRDILSGRELKGIRDELKVSLEAISEMTKIRRVFLRALEEDEIEKIPSQMFLKSFLKAYAQCLGLDPDQVVSRYLKRLEDLPVGGSQAPLDDGKLCKVAPSIEDVK